MRIQLLYLNYLIIQLSIITKKKTLKPSTPLTEFTTTARAFTATGRITSLTRASSDITHTLIFTI